MLTNPDIYQHARQTKFWEQSINLQDNFSLKGYVSQKDASGVPVPEHVPEGIAAIFNEASVAKAVDCPNASAAMSRLCLDLVTKGMMPAPDEADAPQPSQQQRKRLFDRLDWLFGNGALPADLKELADAIRQHGNDGAHDGTCEDVDAADLLDFASNVLERVYTIPERVRLARQRSIDRRSSNGSA